MKIPFVEGTKIIDAINAVVIDNFLSPQECAELVYMADPTLKPSTVVDDKTNKETVMQMRSSMSTYLDRGDSILLEILEDRIQTLCNWTDETEPLHVIKYDANGEYKPHYDWFLDSDEFGLQRVATLIMYIQEPEIGGETYFPVQNVSVKPKLGSALFFSYPDRDKRSLHAGLPVLAGTKYIVTKWFRI